MFDLARKAVGNCGQETIDHLLEIHRLALAERLFAEADRYTKGAFADGIKHAAGILVNPTPLPSPPGHGPAA